jgi:hypothetical protein
MVRGITTAAVAAAALIGTTAGNAMAYPPSGAQNAARHASTIACRGLPGFRGGPINDRGVPHSVAVHGMRCGAAAKTVAHSRLVGGRVGLEAPGYRCRATKTWHVGSEVTGQRIRCTAGSRWFRFQWAT